MMIVKDSVYCLYQDHEGKLQVDKTPTPLSFLNWISEQYPTEIDYALY